MVPEANLFLFLPYFSPLGLLTLIYKDIWFSRSISHYLSYFITNF
jgi:hypothetical protein